MKQIIFILFFLPLAVVAQKSTAFWEVGGYVGGLNYSGEITEEGDLGTWINEMRPEFGLSLKRNFNPIFNLGVEAGWGKLFADDKNHNNPERNYIVNTNIAQANVVIELNFKKFGKFFKRNQNTPYVKAGFGMTFYSPELNTNASYPPEYELYWGTFSTYNFQTAFGWKWRVSNHSIIGVNLHWNITGASNLEGFNLKDTPNPNDAYYGLRFTYSYSIFN